MTSEPVAVLPVLKAVRLMLSGRAVLVRAERGQEINEQLAASEAQRDDARQWAMRLASSLGTGGGGLVTVAIAAAVLWGGWKVAQRASG